MEKTFLLIFIAAFLFAGLSVFENSLKHDVPLGYFASDAFFHAAETDYMAEQGHVKYASPAVVGGNKDVFDIHPPMLFEVSALLMRISSLDSYDAVYFSSTLFLLLSALIMYLVTRSFNKKIAILSLPFMLLIFTFPFNQMMNLGQFLFITGALFMLAMLWSVKEIKEKGMWIVLAFFAAATVISHQPELIYAIFFIIGFLALKIIKKELAIKQITKNLFMAGVLVLILSLYSLNIFWMSWVTGGTGATLGFTTDAGVVGRGFSEISLMTIGQHIYEGGLGTLFSIITKFLLVLGVLFLLMKTKNSGYAAAIGLFGVAISFLIYIGLEKRAFAHRWIWYVYLSIFLGAGLYFLLTKIIKLKSTHCVSIATIILLTLLPAVHGNTKGTIMDPYNWEALKWVSNNVEEDATVYYFYVGNLEQSSTLYFSNRVSRLIVYEYYINALETGRIYSNYSFGLAYGYTQYICERAPFRFGYYEHYEKQENQRCLNDFPGILKGELQENKKICDIEYYYFNKAGRIEPLIQYNMAIRDELLKNAWIKEVYSNPVVSILKNERPGADCFG